MNIFKFELKSYTKSIIIWSLSIVAGLVLYIAFFPAMASNPDGFEEMMNAFPEEVRDLMGINPDLPMTTILGYFSLTYTFIMLPIAIQASNYGFHMLSVEERELTADFLLSKPITRSKVYISKFLAALTSLTITNFVIWIASISSIVLFKGDETVEYKNVLVLLSSIVFFQLFFVSIGMLISVSIKKVSSVLSFSMGLGFGLFIISSMGKMIGLDIVQFISPYSQFEPGYILVEGHYDYLYAIVSIIITIGSLTLSYLFYQRRNIASL